MKELLQLIHSDLTAYVQLGAPSKTIMFGEELAAFFEAGFL
jgi:hypothetical protein